jgi:anaerobic ribonucleoside-triphosphate reductase activating protein
MNLSTSLKMTDQIRYNIATINTCTRAEGPYERLAIWFQGCTLNCPGCCNPELKPLEVRHLVSLPELLSIIKNAHAKNGIEGVTLLGGEPTIQHNLKELCKSIQGLGLGVILFTGFAIETLDHNLLESVDLVIDGPYDSKRKDEERRLIGSTNQRIHLLSKRYAHDIAWFTENHTRIEEINVDDKGLHHEGFVMFD